MKTIWVCRQPSLSKSYTNLYNKNFDIFEYYYSDYGDIYRVTEPVIKDKKFKEFKNMPFYDKAVDIIDKPLLIGNSYSNFHMFSTYEKAAEFKIKQLEGIESIIREKLEEIISKTITKIEKIRPEIDEMKERIENDKQRAIK